MHMIELSESNVKFQTDFTKDNGITKVAHQFPLLWK